MNSILVKKLENLIHAFKKQLNDEIKIAIEAVKILEDNSQ